MKGYDEYNTILLPPRNPGDRLPNELLDYFEGIIKLYMLGHTKCLGSQANFVKKCMREGGFFFSEVFFLFSKNFIKSTTAAFVTLSRMICFISFQSKNLYSILFYVHVEDLKVFIKV
jgi:hypothetical protein